MSDAPPTGAASPRSIRAVLGALGDRLNPVLVKEVRQALRGRAFSVSFVIALSLATLGTTTWMLGAQDSSGAQAAQSLLLMLSFCLALAVSLQVPLSAFQSMAAEWEGDSMDLLQLTNLRPWRIVFGKLCAAGVQVLLYLCAFVPFLLMTFLMRGVGAATIFWALSTMLQSAATLTGLAIALAAFGRARLARVLLLLVLVVACTVAVFNNALRLRFGAFEAPTGVGFQTAGFLQLALSFVWLLYPALLACGVAASRLTHPFEDRSLLPRLVLSVYVVSDLGFATWRHLTDPTGGQLVAGTSMTAMLLVAAFGLFFATEADGLPPVRARGLPRHPRLALAATPFLGGGGRGALFVLLHLALITVVTRGILWLPTGSGVVRHGSGDHAMLVALGLVIVVWVLLPSVCLPRATPKERFTSRFLIPALVMLTTCLPPLVFLFFGRKGTGLDHPGNPFWVVQEFDGANGWVDAALSNHRPLAWALMIVAALALIANLPRILGGVREVRAAGRKLRRR
jgi:hypothetical protein